MSQESSDTYDTLSSLLSSEDEGGVATVSKSDYRGDNVLAVSESAEIPSYSEKSITTESIGEDSPKPSSEGGHSPRSYGHEDVDNTTNSRILRLPAKSEKTPEVSDIDIMGESFKVERLEGGFFLVFHPKWSLSGIGSTLIEAEQAVYEDAAIAAEMYLDEPVSNLDYEANRMRDYLIRIKPIYANSQKA